MNNQAKESSNDQWSLLKPIVLAATFVLLWNAFALSFNVPDITADSIRSRTISL